jgi:hypothetical protein
MDVKRLHDPSQCAAVLDVAWCHAQYAPSKQHSLRVLLAVPLKLCTARVTTADVYPTVNFHGQFLRLKREIEPPPSRGMETELSGGLFDPGSTQL